MLPVAISEKWNWGGGGFFPLLFYNFHFFLTYCSYNKRLKLRKAIYYQLTMYETSGKKLLLVKYSGSVDKASIYVSKIVLAPSLKSELITS